MKEMNIKNEKKKTIITLIIVITIVIIWLYFWLAFPFTAFKDENTFNYDSAKKMTTEYLNKNEDKLNEITKELYESKSLKKYPYEGIKYASYEYGDFYFKKEIEYINFYLGGQGNVSGGQSYGLIYTNDCNEDLIIYDQYEETGSGNNIYIRKLIKDNWYFYYDDSDGNVKKDEIK